MLARLQDIAYSPLPAEQPCDERHLNQCLRVLLAVLPKRNSDEISGELFVAAYQRKLHHLSNAAVSFITDKAMERCQWFPTIAECLEIFGDYRRSDEHVQRIHRARQLVGNERRLRDDDARCRAKFMRTQLAITQEAVDSMSESMIRIGLGCGALKHDEVGKVVPVPPEVDADGYVW